MSKNCSNCVKLSLIVEDQKSKIQMLETRLKDLIRAYKVVCREKDNLSNVNHISSIPSEIDIKQQKRISELEEQVVNLSSLCGNLELQRKKDQLSIENLEENRGKLLNELSSLNLSKSNTVIADGDHRSIKFKHKGCQVIFSTDIDKNLIKSFSNQSSQTENYENSSIIRDIKCSTIKSFNNTSLVITSLERNSDSETSSIKDFSDNESTTNTNFVELESSVHSPSSSQISPNISLFYVNELARKELELAEYKLRVREYDFKLRETQLKYTNEKYKSQSRIKDLEKLNNNFLNFSNNQDVVAIPNHVNVAYIKNVLNKLLETRDQKQRQIMIKALITALDSMQKPSDINR